MFLFERLDGKLEMYILYILKSKMIQLACRCLRTCTCMFKTEFIFYQQTHLI